MSDSSGVTSMDADTVLMHERVLVERARSGNRLAFEEIYQQTSPAAWRLAVALARNDSAAAEAVAAGYAKALNAPGPTAPPQPHPVAAQVLRATREAALDVRPATPATGGPLALRAFFELPERQRAALWLIDAEDRDERAAATVLGLTPDAAAELASRARAGLRQRAAALQLESIDDPSCARTTELLDGYASEELSIRDAGRVRRHLDGCDECRGRLTELDDLLPRLRRAIPLLPRPLRDDAERAWRAAATVASGPLHLRLPGGTQVPAWAERVLAGAAAAVVALGITGALIAGRGDKSAEQLTPEAAKAATREAPLGGGDGESALGEVDDLPLALPDGAPIPGVGGASRSGGTDEPGGTGGDQRTVATSGSTVALPRQVGGTDDSSAPRGGTTEPPASPPASPPETPSAPSTPETPEPPPSLPVTPEADPLTDTVATVLDTVEATVDDACSTLGAGCGGVLQPVTEPLGQLGL